MKKKSLKITLKHGLQIKLHPDLPFLLGFNYYTNNTDSKDNYDIASSY